MYNLSEISFSEKRFLFYDEKFVRQLHFFRISELEVFEISHSDLL